MSSSQEVLFLRNENGEQKWFENGNEDSDGKYIGEIKNGKPNGQGTYTSPDGKKYVGEFKDGKGAMTNEIGCKYLGEWKKSQIWNSSYYDENGNIIGKFVNGEYKSTSTS